jgi:hypothetical protein
VDVGFFLNTHGHVKNDDRDAAEHAASLLMGHDWHPESGDEHRR